MPNHADVPGTPHLLDCQLVAHRTETSARSAGRSVDGTVYLSTRRQLPKWSVGLLQILAHLRGGDRTFADR
jgi:hypothetical protein